MAAQIQRTVFRTLKRSLSRVSDDPYLLHKMVRPVAKGLSNLPGKWGDYWDQVAIYMGKGDLAAEAVRQFDERVAQLGPGSVAIDLGANMGVFTRRLAKTGAEVHAFEPDPWTFEKLSANLDGHNNVVLHNAAVAHEAGEIEMFRPARFADDPASGSVGVSMLAKTDGSQGEAIQVECRNFMEFVDGLDREIDIVKMDIEGAEVALLDALLDSPARDKIKAIFVETHYNMFPEQAPPVAELRRRYGRLDKPFVNFDWP